MIQFSGFYAAIRRALWYKSKCFNYKFEVLRYISCGFVGCFRTVFCTYCVQEVVVLRLEI